jgi:hypothetical protein
MIQMMEMDQQNLDLCIHRMNRGDWNLVRKCN